MKSFFCLIPIFICCLGCSTSASASGTIEVEVLDVETLEPIVSAEVRVFPFELEASTDTTGMCRFTEIDQGIYTATVYRFGYSRAQIESLSVADGVTATRSVMLFRLPFRLPGVETVEGQGGERSAFHHVSTAEDLRRIPTMAEGDLARAMADLPGVVPVSDFSDQLYVQGGDSDENRLLIDGIPILFPSHLGGIASAINTYAIDRVDLYSAGFPAQYGNALSSILDVKTTMGTPGNPTRGRGCFGLLSSQLSLTGGLGARIGWMIGARRTYYDAIAFLIGKSIPFHMGDAQGAISCEISSQDRLTVRGFLSRDFFNPYDNDEPSDEVHEDSKWGNSDFSVSWERMWNSEWLSHMQLSSVEYSLHMDAEGLATHRVKDRIARAGLSGAPFDQILLTLDASARNTDFRYYWTDFEQDADAARFFDHAPSSFDYVRSVNHLTTFADLQCRLSQQFAFRPGIRVSHRLGSNDQVIDPRLSLSYALTPKLTLGAATGTYRQWMAAVNDRGRFALFDVVFPTDRMTSDERSLHAVMDIAYDTPSLTISLQGYLKRSKDILFSAGPEPSFDRGRMDAHGVLFTLEGENTCFHGEMCYSLSRSRTTLNGATYPSSSDKPHNLIVLGQYTPSPLLQISFRWALASGSPYTTRTDDIATAHREARLVHHDDSEETQLASERNPLYHRLDFNVRKTLPRSWGSTSLIFQIINLYNRKNVLHISEDGDSAYQFPFLPSASVEFAF